MDHNNAEIAPDSTRNDGPSVSNSAEANEEQLNDGNKEEIRMSKRQQRKERRRLRMLETRPEKRKLEREKRKRKRMGNNGWFLRFYNFALANANGVLEKV